MNRRDQDYIRDWHAPNYRRPYRTRPTSHHTQRAIRRERIYRVAFGIAGAIVLGAFFVAMLYAPEIRAALAWRG